MLLKHRL